MLLSWQLIQFWKLIQLPLKARGNQNQDCACWIHLELEGCGMWLKGSYPNTSVTSCCHGANIGSALRDYMSPSKIPRESHWIDTTSGKVSAVYSTLNSAPLYSFLLSWQLIHFWDLIWTPLEGEPGSELDELNPPGTQRSWSMSTPSTLLICTIKHI